ncbi:anti-sigma factor RsiW [Arthrobacter sp. UYNi723]
MCPTGEDRYREWTGAYVLGARSPSERREFQRHLGDCAECAASVAEYSGLPALLDLLTHDQALTLGQTATSETPQRPQRPGPEDPTAAAPKETPSPKEHRDD